MFCCSRRGVPERHTLQHSSKAFGRPASGTTGAIALRLWRRKGVGEAQGTAQKKVGEPPRMSPSHRHGQPQAPGTSEGERGGSSMEDVKGEASDEEAKSLWREALKRLTTEMARLQKPDPFNHRPAFEEAFDRMARTQLHPNSASRAMEAAFMATNEDKNRYCDVLPFDKSRVVLGGPGRSASNGTDYINASHIESLRFSQGTISGREEASRFPKYIATQGPLETTVADFWEMAQQQRCSAVIMLCKEVECGRPKCGHYFPSREGASEQFQHVQVTNVKTDYLQGCKSIIHRTMRVESSRSPGTQSLISHFQYADWPDHGVPDSTGPIRSLLRFLRNSEQSLGPFLVHCSAGIGRTGTYCCVDYSLRRILAERDLSGVDIPSIIMGLRFQRGGMVQTAEQFLFCYRTVQEELKELLDGHHKL